MSEIKADLDKVRERLQDDDFLDGKGISNEVNIWIFCYNPKDEMAVRYFVEQLKNDSSLSCNLMERNLYEIFLEICEDKRILERIPSMEEKKGKEFLLKQLHTIATENVFVDKLVYDSPKRGDVMMLTGVGEVFPFMRIHSLLEAIQPRISEIPIIVMYPGTFDGSHVRLFDKLEKNPYYRAFNVI